MLRTRLILAVALVASIAAPGFAQEKGRKVAFLVGVGKYDFAFTDLGKAPENDVTKLAEVLRGGGFEVVVLTSSGTGKDRATKAIVEARFKALLDGGDGKPPLKKADTLLVSLCGHGVQAEAADPATGVKAEQPFFCPADAKPEDTATMVPLNGLIRAVEPHGATSLFLVDACREVKDDNRSRTGIQGKKVNLPAKTAVLFACGQGQLSHQNEKLGHGLFTHAVLKTLTGETGLAGEVSWTDLVGGVEKTFRTPAFATLLPTGKTQTPFEAKGELSYTDLLSITPKAAGKFDADYTAVTTALLKGGSVRAHISDFDKERVAEWGKAADAGDPKAAFLYAASLDRGTAVPKDQAAATRLYQKAAETNEPRALYALAVRYRDGVGGVKRDQSEADRLTQKAAAAGCPKAMIAVSDMYFYGRGVGKDLAQARVWMERAVTAGDLDALCSKAYHTEFGTLGQPANPAEALKLQMQGADAGHLMCLYFLSLKFTVRMDVPEEWAKGKDYEAKTREAVTKLALKDDPDAMSRLAGWLDTGHVGFEKNVGVARQWYEKSVVETNSGYEMMRLAAMYEKGEGTPVNLDTAVSWYRKADALGLADADKALKRLGKK